MSVRSSITVAGTGMILALLLSGAGTAQAGYDDRGGATIQYVSGGHHRSHWSRHGYRHRPPARHHGYRSQRSWRHPRHRAHGHRGHVPRHHGRHHRGRHYRHYPYERGPRYGFYFYYRD